MANKTAAALLQTPDFQALPEDQQLSTLAAADPHFAKLPDGAKRRILSFNRPKPSVGQQASHIEQQAVASQFPARPRSTAPPFRCVSKRC